MGELLKSPEITEKACDSDGELPAIQYRLEEGRSIALLIETARRQLNCLERSPIYVAPSATGADTAAVANSNCTSHPACAQIGFFSVIGL